MAAPFQITRPVPKRVWPTWASRFPRARSYDAGNGLDTSGHRLLANEDFMSFVVSVIQHRHAEVNVNALVTTANPSLRVIGPGVDGQVHQAAGQRMWDELAAKYPNGGVVPKTYPTDPYGLTNPMDVFSVLGPDYRESRATPKDYDLRAQQEHDLGLCYQNALNEAHRLGSQSIAFPPISVDLQYRFPPEKAVVIVMKACREWMARHNFDDPAERKLRRIMFVIQNDDEWENERIYLAAFDDFFPTPDPSREATLEPRRIIPPPRAMDPPRVQSPRNDPNNNSNNNNNRKNDPNSNVKNDPNNNVKNDPNNNRKNDPNNNVKNDPNNNAPRSRSPSPPLRRPRARGRNQPYDGKIAGRCAYPRPDPNNPGQTRPCGIAVIRYNDIPTYCHRHSDERLPYVTPRRPPRLGRPDPDLRVLSEFCNRFTRGNRRCRNLVRLRVNGVPRGCRVHVGQESEDEGSDDGNNQV